jgi:hypothetical protein
METPRRLRTLWRLYGPFAFAVWTVEADSVHQAASRFMLTLVMSPLFCASAITWLLQLTFCPERKQQ